MMKLVTAKFPGVFGKSRYREKLRNKLLGLLRYFNISGNEKVWHHPKKQLVFSRQICKVSMPFIKMVKKWLFWARVHQVLNI